MNPYAVDRKKWAKLSLFEQLGNIGSEVGRTFQATNRGNSQDTQAALTRALDLFDATVDDKSRTKPQLKEILRAKEQFLKALDGETDKNGIERYFTQYAVAARISR